MTLLKKSWIISLILFLSSEVSAQVGKDSALVIIDMQPQFVTRGGNHERPENVIKVKEIISKQTALIKIAKEKNIPIIFIEYDNFGDTNSELKSAVTGYANVKTIPKDTDGMFDPSNIHLDKLNSYLAEKKVKDLIITGANGGACVEASIDGALENNYSVQAFSKGIADFNYEDFIYPYDDKYEYGEIDSSICTSCSFREVDELEVFSLALPTLVEKKNDKPNVDDSDRSILTNDLSGMSRPRIYKQTKNKTKKQ